MINYSFIIPHHNCPKLLNRLLDSIPQREDIEIIVVDDNSDNDKKPNVSRSDVHVVLIPADESKGAGHARNVGLGIAKGKWLLFADSDDYYLDGFIKYLDKYKSHEFDILYFNVYSEVTKSDQDAILVQYEKSEHTHYDRCVLGFANNAPWNKMFRANFVKCIGIKFEEIPSSNDAWFCNSMSVRANSIAIEHSILYRYVINTSGITSKIRPIKDRYIVLSSVIRRNRLKYECGCISSIECHFGFKRFYRDYGLFQAVKYGLIRFIKDKYLRKAIWLKILS